MKNISQTENKNTAMGIPEKFEKLLNKFNLEQVNKDTVLEYYHSILSLNNISRMVDDFFELTILASKDYKKDFKVTLYSNSIKLEILNISDNNKSLKVTYELTLMDIELVARKLQKINPYLFHTCIIFNSDSSILPVLIKIEDDKNKPVKGTSKLMEIFGYTIAQKGMCYGFGFMAIQAFCRDDFSSYRNRFDYIGQLIQEFEKKFTKRIDQVKQNELIKIREQIELIVKAKSSDEFSKFSFYEKNNMLKLLSFFDGVCMYQGLVIDVFDRIHYGAQDYRKVASIFTAKESSVELNEVANKNETNIESKTDKYISTFGDLKCQKRGISIWENSEFNELINEVITAENTISFSIISCNHLVVIGGDARQGCYCVSDSSCIRIFSDLQGFTILNLFSKNLKKIPVFVEVFSPKSFFPTLLKCPLTLNNLTKDTLCSVDTYSQGIFYYTFSYNFVDEAEELFKTIIKKDLARYQGLLKEESLFYKIICKNNISFANIYISEIIKNLNLNINEKIELLSIGNNRDNKKTAFFLACQKGQKEIVELFLNKIIDFELFQTKDKLDLIEARLVNNASSLFIASGLGHKSIVNLLLKTVCYAKLFSDEQKFNFLNSKRKDGVTALFIASSESHHEIVGVFLDFIIKMGNENKLTKKDYYELFEAKHNDISAFHRASNDGKLEVAKVFIKKIMECDRLFPSDKFKLLLALNSNNKSSIYVACKENKPAMTELLIRTICFNNVFSFKNKQIFLNSANELKNHLISILDKNNFSVEEYDLIMNLLKD